jgi:hypothetical protein
MTTQRGSSGVHGGITGWAFRTVFAVPLAIWSVIATARGMVADTVMRASSSLRRVQAPAQTCTFPNERSDSPAAYAAGSSCDSYCSRAYDSPAFWGVDPSDQPKMEFVKHTQTS